MAKKSQYQTFNLSEAQQQQLQKLSAKKDKAIAEIIREALIAQKVIGKK